MRGRWEKCSETGEQVWIQTCEACGEEFQTMLHRCKKPVEPKQFATPEQLTQHVLDQARGVHPMAEDEDNLDEELDDLEEEDDYEDWDEDDDWDSWDEDEDGDEEDG